MPAPIPAMVSYRFQAHYSTELRRVRKSHDRNDLADSLYARFGFSGRDVSS